MHCSWRAMNWRVCWMWNQDSTSSETSPATLRAPSRRRCLVARGDRDDLASQLSCLLEVMTSLFHHVAAAWACSHEAGPDYGLGIVGKCLGPTSSKGPTKDGCKIFISNVLCIVRTKLDFCSKSSISRNDLTSLMFYYKEKQEITR